MADFSKRLILWYYQHQRKLPWRSTKDPYKIWLSEVILQQTRIIQGLPYYQAFIEKFPIIHDLAAAEISTVLRLWQGLGYYTRARNLHACARKVVTQWDGKFPNNYKDLLHLPGIGSYTAAAIASIAFKEAVPVVDGNVLRVLSRIFGIDIPINTGRGKKIITQLAQTLVDPHEPDTYNQAIMDFGATQCLPGVPLCGTCVFTKDCYAFNTNQQSLLPVKSPKASMKQRFLNYLVILWNGKVFMKLRPNKGIWAGLYDFYVVETAQSTEYEQLQDDLVQLSIKDSVVVEKSRLYKHVLTHQILYVSFFVIKATERFIETASHYFSETLVAFDLNAINDLPKPILICNFIEDQLYFKIS